MIKQIKLKNVIIPNNLILAPLAGYTDAAMRRLCREAGAGLAVTEMVSAKGLLYKSKNTSELLKTADIETPSSVQLFGSEPDVFYEVIKNNELLAPFDIIDINMGCPVRKVVSAGEGSALLNNIKNAARIVEAAAKATDKPITIKVRLPDPAAKISLDEIIAILAGSGAAMVTIHGRTAKMMYGGKADWQKINSAAAKSPVPVIGNGDILSKFDALTALYDSTVSGIMIGRGAIGNPWLFTDILQSQVNTAPQSNQFLNRLSVRETALRHIEYMTGYFGEHYTVVNMRKHLAYYVKGLPSMREFKNKINYAADTSTLSELINEHIKD